MSQCRFVVQTVIWFLSGGGAAVVLLPFKTPGFRAKRETPQPVSSTLTLRGLNRRRHYTKVGVPDRVARSVMDSSVEWCSFNRETCRGSFARLIQVISVCFPGALIASWLRPVTWVAQITGSHGTRCRGASECRGRPVSMVGSRGDLDETCVQLCNVM